MCITKTGQSSTPQTSEVALEVGYAYLMTTGAGPGILGIGTVQAGWRG